MPGGSARLVWSGAVAALLTGMLGVRVAAAQSAGMLRIEVDAAQRVTLDGSYPSLQGLLEDLSWRAGFQLRSFGIDDRPVTTHMQAVPLADALRRLVGRDHHVVGMALGAAGASRIVWLEVPGPHERVARRPAYASAPPATQAAPAAVAPFQVPPPLFLAAFSGEDEGEREKALRAIEAQILADPAQRSAFLHTTPAAIADAVAPYPRAAAILQALVGRQADAELRGKLQEVLALLAADPTRAARGYQASPSPLAEFFE